VDSHRQLCSMGHCTSCHDDSGIYFHRLTVHKLPPQEVIVSVFLPLGSGQGGIMHHQGQSLHADLPRDTYARSSAGPLYVLGHPRADYVGFDSVWFFFALASISRSFPIQHGLVGLHVSIGVFAVATTTLDAFKVLQHPRVGMDSSATHVKSHYIATSELTRRISRYSPLRFCWITVAVHRQEVDDR
jgi:hypothetical protein